MTDRLLRFKKALLRDTSWRAIQCSITAPRILTLDTVLLRAGLTLGLIRTVGNA
jgi:hypothetical protein